MSIYRGVGKFCSVVAATLVGTSKSLASQDNLRLGDGAQAFCLENRKSYRYDASSSFGTSFSPLGISGQGIGSWVMEDDEADASAQISGTASFDALALATTVSNTWRALPTGTTWYTSLATSPFWSVSTTSGILTYNGPTGRRCLFIASLAMAMTGVTPEYLQIITTANGSVIGTTTANFAASRAGFGDSAGGTQKIAFCQNSLMTGLVNGSTYQLAMRTVAGAVTNPTLSGFQMAALLL